MRRQQPKADTRSDTSDEPVLLRPVGTDDADALLQLAALLDTVNLPRDAEAIATIVATSGASFAQIAAPPSGPCATSIGASTYTLVAVQGQRLLGTASLLSHHGTPSDPHYYLRVVRQTLRSTQLKTERTRHLLRLEHDQVPWTELGGLVVHPEARGQGLGKLLLAVRLLLIAMHAQYFCTRLLAELLPPRRPDGGNAFWDALGGPLTGLNYYRADLLCRSDKEFIAALFPHHEIVLELLPPEAQAIVGQVGPATVPILKLLQRAGFRYLDTVDPFDGGPHYGATLEEVKPLQCSRSLVCLDLPPTQADTRVLLGNPHSQRFCAALCQICGQGLRLEPATAQLLDLQAGDPVWAIPLDW
jgi:arginine N-succinyltransferase